MWNYEAGLKTQAWDGRLTFNTALFQMNYTDMQVVRLEPFVLNGVPVPGALVSTITNAGKSKVRGGEFEFRLRATDALMLSGGVGYADAQYTSYSDRTAGGAVLDFKGNRLDIAPKTTYNLSAAYEQPISDRVKFSARLDWNSRSDYYRLGGRANNPATDLLQGYDLLSGRIGVVAADGRWELFLVGVNLADSDYVLGNIGTGLPPFTTTGQSAILGRPRYVGLRAALRLE
jgi:iron complex outermembrane receptor protein